MEATRMPLAPGGQRIIDRAGANPDAGMFVQFYQDPLEGKNMVMLTIPGDKNFQPVFEVGEDDNDEYKIRFPEQWAAFQANEMQNPEHTSVDSVAWIDPATAIKLKGMQIFTIEQLASVTDANLDFAMGGRKMRDRAQAEVEKKYKADHFDAQAEEIEQLKARIAQLEKKPQRGRQQAA